MSDWQHRALRFVNSFLLKAIPTCDLQWALETREGVSTYTLGVDQTSTFNDVRGPCTVSINID